ncbi:M14 family metallopeptidase [Shewanella litorisediminis]|uniref:M14 family metallopeptidase n=1 Tax=Shewanella litorisediminis TaxID=1173586 RepID=A0ABX7G4A8_9GAMM|nr:M14 family metallopeptidase [Shewanella litorisediminis]MCL2919382.1 M14 family metallopeptidase [Shewanella litorisediminis]QRH02003.1 M14 family metallopeptidase [Shewanella litorisediminis]
MQFLPLKSSLTLLSVALLSAAPAWATPVIANQFVNDAVLPPIEAWQGASEALMQPRDSKWATPFEQSGGLESPDYEATMAWLDKLVKRSKYLSKVSLGKSPQGRDIWMIVASKEGAATPGKLEKHGKPSVLVQAGIHSGEIDGKDAGMMLLRDIEMGGKSALLDDANLLFVPIFSVDAHERASEYNRVNQRGPVTMGWRTNARNLNLNRDYAKADTKEMQLMLTAINDWNPSLYIDVHVTDGIDYQYDVTFGYNLSQGLSPAAFAWLDGEYRPEIEAALTKAGHIPGPLVFALDNSDITKGMSLWSASPRYSNGYGDARHLPTILIENHSLKPFKQRVLGTYVMLEQTLKTVGEQATALKAAIMADSFAFPEKVTLTWKETLQPKGWDFKGIGYRVEKSPISGAEVVRWTGEPVLYEQLPVMGNTVPDISVSRPEAYYVLPQWQEVIGKLEIHGIRYERLQQPQQLTLGQYSFSNPQFGTKDYEGRQRVSADVSLNKVEATLPVGTIKISTEQALGDLAILLLEPQSPDSLLQWGLFNPIFTRTEYMEQYAVEPMAAKMLAEDPELKKAFEEALKDPAFAADPSARLRWFYEKSPYFDREYLKYPVYRSF